MPGSKVFADELPDGTRRLSFDLSVYGLSSIKKAAYKYGGHFFVRITESADATEVLLKPNDSCPAPDQMIGEFCNEVLDQELRENIARETSGIRDLLLAQAFSKTSLLDAEFEAGNYDSGVDAGTSEKS
jgi:His-Xaa-Ser system protein HxsD